MNNNWWFRLAIWIVSFQIVCFVLGLITQSNLHPWYAELNKSELNPPGWAFSIVWTLLYVLLAIAGWMLWRQRQNNELRPALYFYVIQLLMNWAWTPLFFQLHWIGFSLIWLLIITFFTFLTIYSSKNIKKEISFILIPYFLWLLFASYLNWTIWMLN